MADITSNLTLWSKFDDGSGTSAVDSSGNSHTLTLSGTPSWTGSGKINGALILDGTDDRGQCTLAFGTSTTFAAWVKFAAFPSNQCLIASYSSNTQPSSEWSTVMGVDSSGHVIGYAFDGATPRVASAAALTIGSWAHIAVTFANSGLITAYVNGVVSGTPAALGTQYNSWTSGPVLKVGGSTVGTSNTSFNNFANCQIDDLRLYSRELSAADVAALCASGGNPLTYYQQMRRCG